MTLEDHVMQLALEVEQEVKKLSKDDVQYQIDPLTVIAIISVFLELVKWFIEVYGDKKSPEELAESFGNMNIFQKWILWKTVRKESNSKKEARYIYQSMCGFSKNMTSEDRFKLFSLKGDQK